MIKRIPLIDDDKITTGLLGRLPNGTGRLLSKPAPITVLVTCLNQAINLTPAQMVTLPVPLPLKNP